VTSGRENRPHPPSLSIQRRYWNEWNARYRGGVSLPADAQRRGEAVIAHVRSVAQGRPRILEVGCSTGWLCRELVRYGPTTGIDLADDVVARAREEVPEARFLAGDFLEVDLGARSFDIVVSLETIAHVRDRRAFCRRISDLLVERGHLVITSQNRFIWRRSRALAEPTEILQDLLDMRELKDLLRADFEILAAETVHPSGRGSFLRFVNSRALDVALGAVLGRAGLRRLKEKLGLGDTLVVLARKR